MLNHRDHLEIPPDRHPWARHFEQDAIEAPELGSSRIAGRDVVISIDPAMRSWISDTSGYARGVAIGDVMRAGGIGRVLESRAEDFAVGDLVQGRTGWQSHPILRARETQKLDLTLGSLEDWAGPARDVGADRLFRGARHRRAEAGRDVAGISGGGRCRPDRRANRD